jgi:hypothetical protein
MPKHANPIPWQERTKWVRIKRFLPCFFDVPAKDVHRILAISHHRLDPLRRALNLESWPYNEVVRNRFCMSREEIEGLRARMMEVADPRMRETLMEMEARALECQRALKQPRTKPPARRRSRPDELSRLVQEGLSADILVQPSKPRRRQPVETVPEPVWDENGLPEALWQELGRLPEEQAFWDEISRILIPDDEPSQPLFPE